MTSWTRACATGDVDEEDLIRVDIGNRSFAVYHSPDGEFFCTDGYCTHERIHLADGLVMDHVIECPGHNGQFDYRTGQAIRSPACQALRTYPVRIEDGAVFIDIGDQA